MADDYLRRGGCGGCDEVAVGASNLKVAIYATKYGGNIESLPALVYDKRASLATRKAL